MRNRGVGIEHNQSPQRWPSRLTFGGQKADGTEYNLWMVCGMHCLRYQHAGAHMTGFIGQARSIIRACGYCIDRGSEPAIRYRP
eukprot:scaffold17109_cov33-Tisochrysis_lutea.AAC.2